MYTYTHTVERTQTVTHLQFTEIILVKKARQEFTGKDCLCYILCWIQSVLPRLCRPRPHPSDEVFVLVF